MPQLLDPFMLCCGDVRIVLAEVVKLCEGGADITILLTEKLKDT